MVSVLYECFTLFCILICGKGDENLGWGENITKLYELVSNAAKVDFNNSQLTRRVFVNNSEYQIHLNKLKDVNGLKLHNILIKRMGPEFNSTIYINNPLEAKLPHPFMSLKEFKDALVEHPIKDREAFMRAKKKVEYSRIWASIKATAKPISPKHKESNTTKINNKNVITINNKTTPKNKVKINLKSHTINAKIKIMGNTKKIGEFATVKNLSTTRAENATMLNSLINNSFGIDKPSTPPAYKSRNEHLSSKNLDADNLSLKSIPDNTTTKSSSIDKTLSSSDNGLTNVEEPIPSTTKETTVEEELAAETELDIIGKESTNIVTETTTDAELWTGVDEKEVTNIDDGNNERVYDKEITTSHPSPTITTTRVKWSKPRVYLGEQPENVSEPS